MITFHFYLLGCCHRKNFVVLLWFAIMNDLPVIGHRAMRKELWDRQGANIASRWKEMYGGFRLPANHSLFVIRVIVYKTNVVIFRCDLAA